MKPNPRIVLIGLGYVGLPLAVATANITSWLAVDWWRSSRRAARWLTSRASRRQIDPALDRWTL